MKNRSQNQIWTLRIFQKLLFFRHEKINKKRRSNLFILQSKLTCKTQVL